MFNRFEGKRSRGGLRFCDLLLLDKLSASEGIARADRATRMLILELLDAFPILESNPNINTSISIRIAFLPLDMASYVENPQIENTVSVGIAFFANQLIILENVKRIPFS